MDKEYQITAILSFISVCMFIYVATVSGFFEILAEKLPFTCLSILQ